MSFGPICLVVCCLAAADVASAADDPAAGARLVEESFALLHRANDATEGWRELYDRGIAAAERAIELAPNIADAYYVLFCHLGRKAERAGIAAQAFGVGRLRELVDRTIELDPLHAHAWEAKGEMLIRLPRLLGGSRSKGVEALERAAALAPDWPKPRLRLAEYYRGQNDPERSAAFAREALALARTAGDEKAAAEAVRLLSASDRIEPAP